TVIGPHWFGRHHSRGTAAQRVPRQLGVIVTVWKSEGLAPSPQFRAHFRKTLLDLRKGSLFRLASEDGMVQAVGAHSEAASVQVARLVPGHGLHIIIRLASRLETPAGPGTVQPFHQGIEGQLFESLQLKPRWTMAQRSHQLFAPIEPQTAAIRERAAGNVKDGRHAPALQFRRYFGEVAAL